MLCLFWILYEGSTAIFRSKLGRPWVVQLKTPEISRACPQLHKRLGTANAFSRSLPKPTLDPAPIPHRAPPADPQVFRVDTSEWPDFPVFTAVRLLCRLPVVEDGKVLRNIDSFLDGFSGSLTLSAAYKTSGGSLRLLQYLAAHESEAKPMSLRRWGANAAAGQAAARGDLRTLKWIVQSYLPGEFLVNVVAEAATHGPLSILKWLWENHRENCYWRRYEFVQAALFNDQSVGEWLLHRIVMRDGDEVSKVLKLALSLKNVQLLYQKYHPDVAEAFRDAMLYGRWEVVRWFMDNVADRKYLANAHQYNGAFESSARFGALDLLKELHDRGLVRVSKRTLEIAAENGRLDVVKWLIEEKEVANIGRAFQRAADGGHLDVLNYLHAERGDSCRDSSLNGAASTGSLETVEWLRENTRAHCSVVAMDWAALCGHLEMVQWLHVNYPTEACTMSAKRMAAARGHLDVLKWLHEHGDESGLHACSHEQIDFQRVVDTAAVDGYLEVVQWFHDNCGVRCTAAAMDGAAKNGYLDVVKWLHEHCREEGCTTNAMDDAATNGYLDVVKWLHTNRTEGCTARAMDGAAHEDHLEVVKWLCQNRTEGCSAQQIQVVLVGQRVHSLEIVELLYTRFPTCRNLILPPQFGLSRVEVVEWLLERAPNSLSGRLLRVSANNGHFCNWLQQHQWRVIGRYYRTLLWGR